MPSDFVHLHTHTHYSLLDGACTVKGIVGLMREYDMPSAAITDHGFLGGAQEFYKGLRAANLNPIIGVEAYVPPFSRKIMEPHREGVRGFHLVLLAENNTGYHNLCKLLSEASRTGFYYKPRIDKELLKEYSAGLIGLSACIGGEIPNALLNHDRAKAERVLKEYVDIFGKDNFFIELMDHKLVEEAESNRGLVELARKFDLPLVATNDVHYLRKEHAKAHDVMLCIQTNALLKEEKRMRFDTEEFYFKSPEEMKHLFAEIPEAVTNTRLVAERCNVEFEYVPKVNHYPVYTLSDGTVPGREYLREICMGNIFDRYGFDPGAAELNDFQKGVIGRMDYELSVIDKSKYCSYFLVVSDFIRYAKAQGIPVGPGRGSGAGSLVAYLTLITDIDPLKYNLLFERFLNPERVSPPDFDIDFCEKRRIEVIEYVRNKYGADSVAQICTYGQLKPKAVIKDVARVLERTFEESNQLSKLIPEDPKITLAAALESKDLAAMLEQEEWVRTVWGYATVLEGLNRQLGIHAAGVIIGDQPLDNLVPLTRGAQGEIITQFPAGPCEELGLLKMDFLGLRTLTIIDNALRMIRRNHGIAIQLDKLPLNDAKTFELLRRGDTIAVFQLESEGMQNLCRSFGVDTIEHIIALLAIYRPGPMDSIPEFIARKKGLSPIRYEHPKMEPILRETYGFMLYQEQIMQVVQELAGFSLGGADILRRAIGKKKADVLAEQKSKFVEGCREHNGIPEDVASAIWTGIETFAGYGFNKSHSAAYAFVSFQTAYLKANYPLEFMAAVLTSELANADQISFLTRACKAMGIAVLPPNVNSSLLEFGTDGTSIRFGLGAIKGMGEMAATKIIEARESGGLFRNFNDFCERCGTALNTRMIEHLIRAGAFDGLGLCRSQLLAVAEPMMSHAARTARDRAMGQGSLFDMLGGDEVAGCSIPIPDLPEFERDEILKSEKELLGFYVTGHPLDPWNEAMRALSTCSLNELESQPNDKAVRFCGMIESCAFKVNKKGISFAVLSLEGIDSSLECSLYSKELEETQKAGVSLLPGAFLLVEATVSRREETEKPRILIDRVRNLDAELPGLVTELILHLYEESLDYALLETFRRRCAESPGASRLILSVAQKDGLTTFMESKKHSVHVDWAFLRFVDELFGAGHYRLKGKPHTAAPRRQWKPRPQDEENKEKKG